MFEVETYVKESGEDPVKDFLMEADPKMRAKILMEIDLLSEYGNMLREPYSSALGDGIFELRTKVGSDISRVLYFFMIENKIILTNGFVKKQQKTPKREIVLTKKYRDDYIRRFGK